MSRQIALSDVLRNIAAELSGMAQGCEALEAAAREIVCHPALDPAQRLNLLMLFQGVDAMTQALEDLAGLATVGAAADFSTQAVDVTAIRHILQLQSLADRLVGQVTVEPEDRHPADFLL